MCRKRRLNQLEELYQAFPDAEWDYLALLANPKLTLDLFKHFPEVHRNFDRVSSNSAISVEWLKAFPTAPWNFESLSANESLTPEWFRLFPQGNWLLNSVCANPALRPGWFAALPDYMLIVLSRNPSVNSEWFERFPLSRHRYHWGFSFLSANLGLSPDWLKHFPESSLWDFDLLACNPKLSLEWFDHFPSAPWDTHVLSRNPALSIEWLSRFPEPTPEERVTRVMANWTPGETAEVFKLRLFDRTWDTKVMSYNPGLTVEWFEAYPEPAYWDFAGLSSNPSLKLEWFGMFHADKANWDTKRLSRNPAFTSELYSVFPKRNWSRREMCANPEIYLGWWSESESVGIERTIGKWTDVWSYPALSVNPGLTTELLKWFPKSNWYEYRPRLITNANFCLEWLNYLTTEHADWNFKELSRNNFGQTRDGRSGETRLLLLVPHLRVWTTTPVTRDSRDGLWCASEHAEHECVSRE